MGVSLQDIYDLMDRFEAGSATHLKVKCDDLELELERDGAAAASAAPAPVVVQLTGAPNPPAPPAGAPAPPSGAPVPPPGAPVPAPAPADAAGAAAMPDAPAAEAATASGDDSITAPLVGVFYAAPAPDQEPYVQPGDHVKKGDTVCLLEAMKMMSEVPAPCDCTVEEVLVTDGELVEFGAPLIRYRAD